jgi:hypothetical protein
MWIGARRGKRPVDIVFYTANNLQNYSYQVNRIGVFKFASFLIYIHFLSTAILYSFKALLCSETPQDSIAANEELLSGVAELKTSLLITLMTPLFEMSCITISQSHLTNSRSRKSTCWLRKSHTILTLATISSAPPHSLLMGNILS